MSDEKVATDGPFEIDVKVHITNGDDGGVVTVGLAKGEYPTAENIKLALSQAAKAAEQRGFRLMNRHEFIEEMLGVGGVAIPGPKDFPAQ